MAEAKRAIKEFLFARMYRPLAGQPDDGEARRRPASFFSLLLADTTMLPDDWRAAPANQAPARAASTVADYVGACDRFRPRRISRLTGSVGAGVTPSHCVGRISEAPSAIASAGWRFAYPPYDPLNWNDHDDAQHLHPMRERVLAALRADLPELTTTSWRGRRDAGAGVAHGDMATNAGTGPAKPARRRPQEIATALAQRLPPSGRGGGRRGRAVSSICACIPAALRAQVPAILHAASPTATAASGRPATNVEYVSPTRPGRGMSALPRRRGRRRARQPVAKGGFAVTRNTTSTTPEQVVALAWAAYGAICRRRTTLTEEAFSEAVPGGCNIAANIFCPLRGPGARVRASLAGPDTTIASPALWLDRVRNSRSTHDAQHPRRSCSPGRGTNGVLQRTRAGRSRRDG